MSDQGLPQSEIILYQTEDGRTRIQCRLEDETLWLTQAQMAALFDVTPQNVTLHLKAIFAEGELTEEATCKDYLQVRLEGQREVSRTLRHYRLEAIVAVGFRVQSMRGTQFRQWAIGRLNEFLVKGFAMDDERLKNPPGKGQTDYFDELLERIRDIRSSERRFTSGRSRACRRAGRSALALARCRTPSGDIRRSGTDRAGSDGQRSSSGGSACFAVDPVLESVTT